MVSHVDNYTNHIYFGFLIISIITAQVMGWIRFQNVNIVASGASAVGTLLLAWLTFQTIRQNNKMVQQQQAQSKPVLRQINDFEPTSNPSRIRFDLQNIGGGTAYSIKFCTEIYIPDLNINTAKKRRLFHRYTSENNIRLDSITRGIYQENDVQITAPGATGGVLHEDSSGQFEYRIDFSNENRSDVDMFTNSSEEDEDDNHLPQTIVFNRLLEYLKENDIEYMAFQFKLFYRDVYGKEYMQEFPTRGVPIEDTTTVTDLIEGVIWVHGKSNIEQKSLSEI